MSHLQMQIASAVSWAHRHVDAISSARPGCYQHKAKSRMNMAVLSRRVAKTSRRMAISSPQMATVCRERCRHADD